MVAAVEATRKRSAADVAVAVQGRIVNAALIRNAAAA